jgi:leader peptidase (prepilin peptidase)/N-methyltransferase
LYALVGSVFAAHVFVTPFILLVMLTLIQLTAVSVLLAITVYDLRHTIIPDEWVALFAVLSLILALLFPLDANNSKLVAVLAGPSAALPLFLLWLVSGGRWMGLGDPKLALGIGWLLGFPLGIIAIFFSFILGSAILLPVMAFEKIITHMRVYRTMRHGLTIKSEVPFGPFLIASALLLWFFQLYGIAFPLDILGPY